MKKVLYYILISVTSKNWNRKFAEKFSQATNFELRFDEKDIYTWNYRKDATKNTLELVRIRLNKYITKFYA